MISQPTDELSVFFDSSRRFVCPNCGSNRWGTSNLNKPMDEWVGHCNGWKCSFTWNRKDDATVFVTEQTGGAKP